MAKIRVCSECGVPRHIAKQIIWRDNGVGCQRRNPDHRIVYIESDNINGILEGIEKAIGVPIEHIVAESMRRSSYDYLDNLVPARSKAILKRIGVRPIFRQVERIGRILGYGSGELVSSRRKHDEGDYVTMLIRDPYSLPLYCGNFAAAMEVFDGREVKITHKEISPGEFEVTARFFPRLKELEERLARNDYVYKDGGLKLEKCPRCGVPAALKRFEFDLDKGISMSMPRNRRMVGLGPASIEAIFAELEKELGETIPQVVIYAQCQFVAAGFFSIEEVGNEKDLRAQLATRGLGNLREMHLGDESMRFRLENTCLHLMMVGMFLGIFELVHKREGEAAWDLSADDVLTVEITPKA
jgi:hypothetical protein